MGATFSRPFGKRTSRWQFGSALRSPTENVDKRKPCFQLTGGYLTVYPRRAGKNWSPCCQNQPSSLMAYRGLILRPRYFFSTSKIMRYEYQKYWRARWILKRSHSILQRLLASSKGHSPLLMIKRTRTFTLKVGKNDEHSSVPEPRSEAVHSLSAIGDTRVTSSADDSLGVESATARPERAFSLPQKVLNTVPAVITPASDHPSQPHSSIMKIQLPRYTVPPPPPPTAGTLRSRQGSNRPASTRTPQIVSAPEKGLRISPDVAATIAPPPFSIFPLAESCREATSQKKTDGGTHTTITGSDDLLPCSTIGEALPDVSHMQQEELDNDAPILSPHAGPSTTRNTPPLVTDAALSHELTPPELSPDRLTPGPLGGPSALSPYIGDLLRRDTVVPDPTATPSSDTIHDEEVLNPDPPGSQTASVTVPGLSTNDLQASKDNFDSLVPEDIPEEMQAIVDAYLRGKPIGIMISTERLRIDWGLSLGEEYGYVSMGWFRVIGVQVWAFASL